ncbi:MAG TPA: outer membrane beta-barrel protein [Bradyrhizobium sp.]|nr:outer membrane beta-barrel protein [Bradyrhizobium sp.]
MRRFLLTAVVAVMATGARAADMPDFLRGSLLPPAPPPIADWDGFYVGGQAGYGSSDENFNGATSDMTSALLADTLIEQEMQVSQWNLELGKDSHRAGGFGAFAGYNWQWDDIVVGVEGSYLHADFGGSASATEARRSTLSDGLVHNVTATSQASIAISDMATFRARAGYAFGCFLPYVFGGFALGNADISRSITVQDVENGVALAPLSASDAEHNHLVYGYSAGLGIDYKVAAGLFLRGEWEYTRFTSAVDTSINTVRAGIGYKF